MIYITASHVLSLRWKGPSNLAYSAWAHCFSLHLTHFVINIIVRSCLATKVRNEWRWLFTNVVAVHGLHVVPKRAKASYNAGMSYLDASFIVNLLLTRQKSMSLGVDSQNSSTVTCRFRRISCTKLASLCEPSTQVWLPWSKLPGVL